jgi:hypothetical protein
VPRRKIGRYSFKFEAFERDCLLLRARRRAPRLHEADITAFEAKHPAPYRNDRAPRTARVKSSVVARPFGCAVVFLATAGASSCSHSASDDRAFLALVFALRA